MPDSVRRHPCQVLSIRSSSITPGLRGRRGLRSWRGLRNWRGLRRRKGLSLTDLTDTRSHLRGCKDRSKATWDPRQRSKATRLNVHPPWPSGWCGRRPQSVMMVRHVTPPCTWAMQRPGNLSGSPGPSLPAFDLWRRASDTDEDGASGRWGWDREEYPGFIPYRVIACRPKSKGLR